LSRVPPAQLVRPWLRPGVRRGFFRDGVLVRKVWVFQCNRFRRADLASSCGDGLLHAYRAVEALHQTARPPSVAEDSADSVDPLAGPPPPLGR